MRLNYSGDMVINTNLDYIKGLTALLFGMRKGYDRYSPDMGLDLISKRYEVINNPSGRDTEYEQEIKEQFLKYLGLTVVSPVVHFGKGRYIVTFSVIYEGEAYHVTVSSNAANKTTRTVLEEDSDLQVLVVNSSIIMNL